MKNSISKETNSSAISNITPFRFLIEPVVAEAKYEDGASCDVMRRRFPFQLDFLSEVALTACSRRRDVNHVTSRRTQAHFTRSCFTGVGGVAT